MTNATEDYNTFVRANLPSGMTYSNFRYWVYGKPFVSYKQAKWYLDYTTKMIYLNPPLDLNFLTGTMPSGLTFTRASTATYIGSDGLLKTAAVDVPRLDYDPVTLACKGLLIEGSRTNLLLRSGQFDNAPWGTTNATVAVSATGTPLGLAYDLIENTATTTHGTSQAVNVVSGTAYTFSICAKAKGRSLIRMGAAELGAYAIFDLAAGTVQHTDAGVTARITALGGGVYRCAATLTAAATASYIWLIRTQSSTSEWPGSGIYTGDGVSGVSIVAAQLEAGAFPSSYIPTTTAAVTRAADVCLMTGTDFSRWFNPVEGTFVWEIGPFNGVVIGGVGDTFDNVQYAPSSGFVTVRSAGAISAQMNIGSLAGGGKVSWAYKANDFAASANGGAVATDTSGAVPLSNVRLKIGGSPWVAGADSEPYGPVSRLRYYPRRLSNARLQELTA